MLPDVVYYSCFIAICTSTPHAKKAPHRLFYTQSAKDDIIILKFNFKKPQFIFEKNKIL